MDSGRGHLRAAQAQRDDEGVAVERAALQSADLRRRSGRRA